MPDSTRELLGSLVGRTAIVCGTAEKMFLEFFEAVGLARYKISIFAVNDAGAFLPAEHWVSLHGDRFDVWRKNRKSLAYKPVTHTMFFQGMADFSWSGLSPYFALSGYFAMQLAWIMGASEIFLCGCPGNAAPRFDGSQNETRDFGYGTGATRDDKQVRDLLESEMRRLPDFKAAVRSMSGFTREYFGEPECLTI